MWKCEKTTDNQPETTTTNPGGVFERTGNRLYFYSEVSRGEVLKLNKAIIEAEREMKICQIEKGLVEPPQIFLHINSYGGVIFDGLAAMDSILKSEVSITTVVDGCAASAATFMSVVGKHRQINANAYMLIHQLSSSTWGKYSSLVDHKENMDELMKKIKEIYRKYTKVPTKQLNDILKRDIWWDAKKCLQFGLVDEII